MRPIFITGTDTDAGKTYSAVALIHALRAQQQTCRVLKPVAAGAERIITESGPQLRNTDALQLLYASGEQSKTRGLKNVTANAYWQANPYCFAPPIAPHIAAHTAMESVTVTKLKAHYDKLPSDAKWCIIEGAGGWLVPLNEHESLADFAQALNAPIILVVGMKLGCLNHALLTVADIERRGLTLAGWIANTTKPEPMPYYADNLATLKQRIAAPLLAQLTFTPDAEPAQLAAAINLQPLDNY